MSDLNKNFLFGNFIPKNLFNTPDVNPTGKKSEKSFIENARDSVKTNLSGLGRVYESVVPDKNIRGAINNTVLAGTGPLGLAAAGGNYLLDQYKVQQPKQNQPLTLQDKQNKAAQNLKDQSAIQAINSSYNTAVLTAGQNLENWVRGPELLLGMVGGAAPSKVAGAIMKNPLTNKVITEGGKAIGKVPGLKQLGDMANTAGSIGAPLIGGFGGMLATTIAGEISDPIKTGLKNWRNGSTNFINQYLTPEINIKDIDKETLANLSPNTRKYLETRDSKYLPKDEKDNARSIREELINAQRYAGQQRVEDLVFNAFHNKQVTKDQAVDILNQYRNTASLPNFLMEMIADPTNLAFGLGGASKAAKIAKGGAESVKLGQVLDKALPEGQINKIADQYSPNLAGFADEYKPNAAGATNRIPTIQEFNYGEKVTQNSPQLADVFQGKNTEKIDFKRKGSKNEIEPLNEKPKNQKIPTTPNVNNRLLTNPEFFESNKPQIANQEIPQKSFGAADSKGTPRIQQIQPISEIIKDSVGRKESELAGKQALLVEATTKQDQKTIQKQISDRQKTIDRYKQEILDKSNEFRPLNTSFDPNTEKFTDELSNDLYDNFTAKPVVDDIVTNGNEPVRFKNKFQEVMFNLGTIGRIKKRALKPEEQNYLDTAKSYFKSNYGMDDEAFAKLADEGGYVRGNILKGIDQGWAKEAYNGLGPEGYTADKLRGLKKIPSTQDIPEVGNQQLQDISNQIERDFGPKQGVPKVAGEKELVGAMSRSSGEAVKESPKMDKTLLAQTLAEAQDRNPLLEKTVAQNSVYTMPNKEGVPAGQMDPMLSGLSPYIGLREDQITKKQLFNKNGSPKLDQSGNPMYENIYDANTMYHEGNHSLLYIINEKSPNFTEKTLNNFKKKLNKEEQQAYRDLSATLKSRKDYSKNSDNQLFDEILAFNQENNLGGGNDALMNELNVTFKKHPTLKDKLNSVSEEIFNEADRIEAKFYKDQKSNKLSQKELEEAANLKAAMLSFSKNEKVNDGQYRKGLVENITNKTKSPEENLSEIQKFIEKNFPDEVDYSNPYYKGAYMNREAAAAPMKRTTGANQINPDTRGIRPGQTSDFWMRTPDELALEKQYPPMSITDFNKDVEEAVKKSKKDKK